ncbi:MAG: hypothetical protein LW720_01380 [Pirellula sp.]|nr:hypothetical protein [Pirellula sp.]
MSRIGGWISQYSMVLVLLGLCAFFSAMTVREQQPTAREAVEQVWGRES